MLENYKDIYTYLALLNEGSEPENLWKFTKCEEFILFPFKIKPVITLSNSFLGKRKVRVLI